MPEVSRSRLAFSLAIPTPIPAAKSAIEKRGENYGGNC